MYLCIYVFMYLCIYVFIHSFIHSFIHLFICTYVNKCVYIYIWMCKVQCGYSWISRYFKIANWQFHVAVLGLVTCGDHFLQQVARGNLESVEPGAVPSTSSGCIWKCQDMVGHGLSWFIMVYHGLSWFIMVYHGLSWSFPTKRLRWKIGDIPPFGARRDVLLVPEVAVVDEVENAVQLVHFVFNRRASLQLRG